jgi:hypothetical protein
VIAAVLLLLLEALEVEEGWTEGVMRVGEKSKDLVADAFPAGLASCLSLHKQAARSLLEQLSRSLQMVVLEEIGRHLPLP